MRIPKDKAVYESPLGSVWIDENLLCIVAKNVKRTGNNVREHYDILKDLIKERMNVLLDLQMCEEFNAESRKVIKREGPNFYKAVAILAERPCELFIAHFFMPLSEKNVPIKYFKSESEARKWLKQF